MSMSHLDHQLYDGFDWGREELCKGLLCRLQSNDASVETRDFLKPIFKWTKFGNRNYDVEKAFCFAEWMTLLNIVGDTKRGFPRMPHLQPKYALNTLVTMGQRSSSVEIATRAYEAIKRHKYDPDVFTLTALMDVVGRATSNESEAALHRRGDPSENGPFKSGFWQDLGDGGPVVDPSGLQIGFRRAFEIYMWMRASESAKPNVVTFVTIFRIIGEGLCGGSAGPSKLRSRLTQLLLSHASSLKSSADEIKGSANSASERSVGASQLLRSNGVLDASIFNAALRALVVRFHHFFRRRRRGSTNVCP
jgi:hypothetical protein